MIYFTVLIKSIHIKLIFISTRIIQIIILHSIKCNKSIKIIIKTTKFLSNNQFSNSQFVFWRSYHIQSKPVNFFFGVCKHKHIYPLDTNTCWQITCFILYRRKIKRRKGKFWLTPNIGRIYSNILYSYRSLRIQCEHFLEWKTQFFILYFKDFLFTFVYFS